MYLSERNVKDDNVICCNICVLHKFYYYLAQPSVFFSGFCSCSFSLAHFVFGFCYVLPWSLGRDDYKIHIHTYKKKGKKIYVSWRVMCLVFVCLQCMTPKKNCDSRHAYAFSVKQTCVHIKQRRRHTTMNNNNNNNQINLSYSRAAAKKIKWKKKCRL